MGAHEDRPALARKQFDHIADLRHAPRIQARRGLVEDEEFRFVEQRLGDGEPLLHPLGELLDSVVRPFGQLDLLQDGLAPSLDLVRRHSAEAPHIGESLERREVSVELRRLNHRTDAREGTGRLPAHLDAEEDGAAPRRSDQVCHDLDRRGLSRAVRTEEPEGRALRDGEIEGLQGREVTVLLAQPLQVNRDFAGDRFRAGGLHDPLRYIAIYLNSLKGFPGQNSGFGIHRGTRHPLVNRGARARDGLPHASYGPDRSPRAGRVCRRRKHLQAFGR